MHLIANTVYAYSIKPWQHAPFQTSATEYKTRLCSLVSELLGVLTGRESLELDALRQDCWAVLYFKRAKLWGTLTLEHAEAGVPDAAYETSDNPIG